MIENIKNIKEDLKKQYNDLLKLVPESLRFAKDLLPLVDGLRSDNPAHSKTAVGKTPILPM